MSEWHGGRWEVEEIAEDDVEEDVEVIGVEIFVRGGGCEEKVEELEN